MGSSVHNLSVYNNFTKDLDKNLSILWFGFVLFCFGSALASTYATGMIKVIQLFQLIALLSIIYAMVSIIQFKVANDYLRLMLVLYFCWSIFVVLNGFVFEYDFIKRSLFSGNLFKYFVPLIIFVPKNLNFYKKVFNVIVISSIFYLILNILFYDIVLTHYDQNVVQKFTFEYFTKILGVPAGFLLFTYIYHSKNRNTLAFVVVLVILLIATYKARRAIMVLSAIHLLTFMVIFYFNSHKKIFISICIALFISIVGIYGGQIYQENKDTFFSEILERGAEDTRTGVELALKRDFDTVDWIIGRGINGKYWCPNIDLNDTTGYREMIETDYLNIILKGGIIHLALIILIALPAMVKAFFYSKNLLSKAAAIWIFLWIISLYPLNVYNFDINYVLLWICVGIGYSKDLRELSDEVIKKGFASQ